MELSSTLSQDLCDRVEVGGDFAQLRRRVLEAGLLKQQPLYYAWQALWCTALLASSIAVLALTESIWWHLLDAPLMAFAFTQIMLLGHDAGHRQIGRIGTAILYACATCVGMSPLAWLDVHNAHHAHPNREDMDPDIEQPFLAYSRDQVLQRRGWWLARLVMRHQATLYFPLLTFVAWSIRNTGVQYLRKLPLRESWLDWLLFAVHFSAYLGILFLLLPWWHAVLFIILHQLAWGIYVGSIFAPNHKGMEMLQKDQTIDYLREQVTTARNIRPGFFTDLWYGGLNYQIEHHLFPVMPRRNLPKLRALVREHCRACGVPYHETGICQSYREILAMMREIALFARRLPECCERKPHDGVVRELRQSALASIDAARRQWTDAAAAYMHAASEAQLKQWEAVQIDSVRRLDDMRNAITTSAHLKRMKLLQYQREAERMMGECQKRWAVVTAQTSTA